MTDEKQSGFDPDEHNAPDVVQHLKEATEAEKAEIAAEEARGRARKTVLEAAGRDPNKRYDASGRELMPWETAPKPVEESAGA